MKKYYYIGKFEQLKDFGFEKFTNGCGSIGYSIFDNGSYFTIMEDDKEDNGRLNRLFQNNIKDHLSVFYQLIKAGLVEERDE